MQPLLFHALLSLHLHDVVEERSDLSVGDCDDTLHDHMIGQGGHISQLLQDVLCLAQLLPQVPQMSQLEVQGLAALAKLGAFNT